MRACVRACSSVWGGVGEWVRVGARARSVLPRV